MNILVGIGSLELGSEVRMDLGLRLVLGFELGLGWKWVGLRMGIVYVCWSERGDLVRVGLWLRMGLVGI